LRGERLVVHSPMLTERRQPAIDDPRRLLHLLS